MKFRVLFLTYAVALMLSLRWVLGLANGAAYEKAILLACGFAFLIERKLIPLNILILAFMATVTLVMAFLTQNANFGWDRYGHGLISLMAPFLFFGAQPSRRDRDFMLQVMAIMPLMSAVIQAFYAARGMHDTWWAGRLELSLIPSGIGSVCYVSIFAGLLCIAMKMRGYTTVVVLDVIILILSGARMPMGVTAILGTVTYAYAVRRLTFMRAATLAAGAICTVGGLMMVSGKLFSRVFSTSLTGRDQIWAGMEAIHERFPWVGAGLGHSVLLMPDRVKVYVGTIAAHDEYLRLMVDCGNIGMVLVVTSIAAMMINIWRSKRVAFSPIFGTACATFFLYTRTDNTISAGLTPLVMFAAAAFFADYDEAPTLKVADSHTTLAEASPGTPELYRRQ